MNRTNYKIIHVFGASGSGTSTLAKAICDKTGFHMMEVDSYFWLPTDPPFTVRRSSDESAALMQKDIDKFRKVVVAGSATGWGDFLIPQISLAIRLETPTEIRIERIKQRELMRFGERIQPGGDMYEQHHKFIDWAQMYDEGGVEMRSKRQHDEWQKKLECKLLILDGTKPVTSMLEDIANYVAFI